MQAFGGAQPANQRNAYALSPSWSHGAPLSKFFTLLVIIAHVVLEMGGLKGTAIISLDYDAVVFEGQIRRLFLYPITFATITELVMGLGVLCPLMQRFEREMGTDKLASFLFFKTIIIATILQCILIECFAFSEIFAPGPYPHIGALLYLYHQFTPKQFPNFFGILGFNFSEKSLTYGFAFQFLIVGDYMTIIPTLCGALAAFMSFSFPSSAMHPKERLELRLPNIILKIASLVGRSTGLSDLLFTPPLAAAASGSSRRPATAQQPHGPGGRPAAPAQFQAPPPPPPPSDEAVEQLTNMGFARDAVIQALQATDNNVEAAANRLLTA